MKVKIILLAIIALATFFRFYRLDFNPPSLDWDETGNAWNAYSIMKTGVDEYGVPHPLTLRSFNDYKPAMYAYAMMPTIKLFGLNEFAARLPSVLFGSMLTLLMYFLIWKVTCEKKLALLAAFLTAVNPWMIQFSRGAFEANLGLFLFVAGLTCMAYYRKTWLYFLGIVFFAASVYAYHANKFVGPAAILVYVTYLTFHKKIKLWQIFGAVLLSILILLPFANSIFRGYGLTRLNATTGNTNLTMIVANYFSHFNFDFLFLNGDANARHHVTGFGSFYVFESILMLLGVVNFVKNWRNKLIFLTLFALSLVPSAIAQDAPHAIRSLLSFPFFLIFIMYGFKDVRSKISKIIIVALYAYFIFFYANSRFVHYPAETSQAWQYGYKQVTDYLFRKNNYDKYNKIVVTNAYDQPYIYMLLGGKDKFLLPKNDGTFQNGFDKFEFKKINWDEEKNRANVLLIGTEDELRDASNVLDTIYFLDGKMAFKLVSS